MNDNYQQFFDAEPIALKYGENPHQKAFFYVTDSNAKFENLSDIELSYNNILDMTAAINIVSEFFDVPAVAIVKHNTPCGVALGKSIEEAYLKAFDTDPMDRQETIELVRAYYKIPNRKAARHLYDLIISLSKSVYNKDEDGE